jgi:V8-like Glu-specific endopeptidase
VIFRLIVLFLISFSILAGNKVIYGSDDRVEINDSVYRFYSGSVAGLFDKRDFDRNSGPEVKVIRNYRNLETYRGYETCNETRFREQPTVANCTGFLVGPDILVTAGHCAVDYGQVVRNKENRKCKNAQWVFGYDETTYDESKVTFKKKNIFGCKKIISASYTLDADFAVIKLERRTHKRITLKMNADKEQYQVGSPVSVIGHPTGLPLKFAGGSTIAANSYQDSFLADLDTFGGNSGSPVFNQEGEVIGILVAGETDYIVDKERQCIKVNECRAYNEECESEAGGNSSGETVTKISFVIKALKK